MFFEIAPACSQAIYEQAVQQVKFAIAAGGVQADEMIPSVRDLSKTLVINPNTVARDYRSLQDDGVVCSRRRKWPITFRIPYYKIKLFTT